MNRQQNPSYLTWRRDFTYWDVLDGASHLVYLDHATTSQKPKSVIEAMTKYLGHGCANVHRSVNPLAEKATLDFENTRQKIAAFFQTDSRGVIFTKNCTEAINLVAYCFARTQLKADDEILLSRLEHHANLVPWQQAAEAVGAKLRWIPITEDGDFDLSNIEELFNKRTRLVAISAMSNVLGWTTNFAPLVQAAKAHGATVLLDIAQLAAHQPFAFSQAEVDFAVLSGHKLLGPTGVGVLLAKPELLEKMPPFLTGGEMVLDVTWDQSSYNEIPYKFEAGTPPIAEVIGLGAAIDYLKNIGWADIQAHELVLANYGLAALAKVAGLRLWGSKNARDARRAPIFAFNLYDQKGELIHPHDVGMLLGEYGIAIRSGHHCAKPLINYLGAAAICRASCGLYNSKEDIDALTSALNRVVDFFSKKLEPRP